MQRTDGLRRVLSSAPVYSLFQTLAGATRMRRWLASHFWKIPPAAKVVDIGCGPGDVVPHLPADAEYIGLEPSEPYVRLARRRFATRPRTTFACGVVDDVADDPRFRDADIVLCNAVLHHLEDAEAERVLAFARKVLKPGGAFRCVEAVFLDHQGAVSRWVMGLDRGGNIRTEGEWRALMARVFDRSDTRITTNLIRLPYVHILLEGINPR